ncbi:MAG: methyltransferase domain-containing protein [Flavobacterium sp.]
MIKKNTIYNHRVQFANQKLDELFSLAPNKIVSDVGAGFGHMQAKIEGLGATWQPFDYFKKIDKSIIWDLNNSEPDDVQKAGIVLFLEVLEHLANPLIGINNISNHIEKGGYLILSVPNPSWSRSRLNMFFKGTLFSFQPKHLEEHHVFAPWFHIVEYFLKESGFELLEYAIIDEPSKPQTLKERIKRFIEIYIESRDIQAKGLSYGILAKKL